MAGPGFTCWRISAGPQESRIDPARLHDWPHDKVPDFHIIGIECPDGTGPVAHRAGGA